MTNTPIQFTYGECVTDHKDGEELQNVFDFFNHRNLSEDFPEEFTDFDKPIYDFVRDTFKKLGLRFPMAHNVYHGSDHEILFLNSHGIVIRVGQDIDTDPRNFLHPHLPQPLGWVRLENEKITITLYPATHVFGYTPFKVVSMMEEALERNNFGHDDLQTKGNVGYLKLKSVEKYPLDIDLSARVSEDPDQRKTYRAFQKALKTQKPFDALKVLFANSAGSPYSTEVHQEAFDFHQPLRHAFFSAWPKAHENKGSPDPKRMERFWEMARNYVEKGYIVREKSKDGKEIIQSRRETPVPWKNKR